MSPAISPIQLHTPMQSSETSPQPSSPPLENMNSGSSIDEPTPAEKLISKYNLENFPMCLPSADIYIDQDRILQNLSDLQLVTDRNLRSNHIFGFTKEGHFYDYKVRDQPPGDPNRLPLYDNPGAISGFTDSEVERILKCDDPAESYRFYLGGRLRDITPTVMKAIFAEHDFDTTFLQTTIRFDNPESIPIGSRSLNDREGVPKAYDIYIILPSRAANKPWGTLREVTAGLLPINPRSYLEVFSESNPTKTTVIGETSKQKVHLKYDLKTRKTTVFLQVGGEKFNFCQLLQDAFVAFKREKDTDQRDPFFIIIIALRHWTNVWRRVLDYISLKTEWLDQKVQDFISSDGNEVEKEYGELNSKMHITQRHVSAMRSEIIESKLIFKFTQEQHTSFLEFSGLNSETSTRVREQLTVLLLDIETLGVHLEQELDKIKTSSAWLSTSISLKHTKAMRIASEESHKASLALKENTDAMKAGDDLLRELAQETLQSNLEMKKNGDAMRQIAEESKKIAEANSKESETMTQIAKSTQKDSQSMKVLAFLTMMYLPGAFVSSIFGWSIISFDVSEDGTQQLVVAKEWRLFVISTVALTIGTVLGCLCWIWVNRKKLGPIKPAGSV
ncbi:hypothetical protein TWF173_010227 [Orbilia oligospora]|nr:hypothetical protein TWF173_010227 [Orbilia oligospora]